MTEITIKRAVFEQMIILFIYLLHYSMKNIEQQVTFIHICSIKGKMPQRNRRKLEQIAIKKALCSNESDNQHIIPNTIYYIFTQKTYFSAIL